MTVYIQDIHLIKPLPDRQNSRDLFVWLKEIIPASIKEEIDSDLCGLYIATKDFGAASSVQFWRDALTTGFAFANPREFPVTLSSYLASMIAMHLSIKGINQTFVGECTVYNDAFIQAILDLQSKKIKECLIFKIPALQTNVDKSGQNIIITHLIMDENNSHNPLLAIQLCSKSNQTDRFKTVDDALYALKEGGIKGSEYYIQTDLSKDMCIQLF